MKDERRADARRGAWLSALVALSCTRDPPSTVRETTTTSPPVPTVDARVEPSTAEPRLDCVREHPTEPAYAPVIRALCAELHDLGGVSASVAIAVDERLVFSTAVGPRCQGQAEPLRPTTLLGIGSTTKLITAAVALTIAERRGVSVDAPLTLELDQPRPSPAPTLRQLLTHTAGFRDPEPSVMLAAGDQWPQRLAEHRQAPGAHHYANASYLMVGRWLEQTTGRTFAELYVDEPSLASVRRAVHMTVESTKTVSCGHRAADGWIAVDPTGHPPLAAWTLPAGGGWASAEDLVRLPAALRRTGRLPAMVEARVPSDRPGWDYGLGVRIRGDGAQQILAHAGDTGTYWAEVQWSPRSHVAVAVLSSTPQAFKATLHAAFSAGQAIATP